MGIFSRFSDLVVANLNALLDWAENPELMLDHVIREMEETLARARRYVAVAVAAESRLRHGRDDNHEQGEVWKSRAREALAAGREDLAWRALARKQECDVLSRSLEKDHAEAVQAVQSARAALQALEARLAEACHKRQALLARHRTAQARADIYRHLGADRTNFGAFRARFDCLVDRLSQRVAELDAEAELRDSSGPEAEFTEPERRLAIGRELAALRRERPREAD
jgi:phage shock protein A